MNLLKTSDIVDPVIGEPFTGPMLAYLQNAYNEVVAALAQSLTGNNTVQLNTPYILYGCISSVVGTNTYAFTSGYIFYNGIIYYLPAITNISLPGGLYGTTTNTPNDAICTITTTTDASVDPLVFTDLVPRNVTLVSRLVISNGTPITNNSLAFNYYSAVNIFKATRFEQNYSYNVAGIQVQGNGTTVTLFSMTASCDMQDFKIQGTILQKLQVGLNDGTLSYNLRINGGAAQSFPGAQATQFVANYSNVNGTYPIRTGLTLQSNAVINKYDLVELIVGVATVPTSNMWVTLTSLELVASANQASNF